MQLTSASLCPFSTSAFFHDLPRSRSPAHQRLSSLSPFSTSLPHSRSPAHQHLSSLLCPFSNSSLPAPFSTIYHILAHQLSSASLLCPFSKFAFFNCGDDDDNGNSAQQPLHPRPLCIFSLIFPPFSLFRIFLLRNLLHMVE